MKRIILLLAIVVVAATANAQIKLGCEVLEAVNFRGLEGKRVGLITNPTGVDSFFRSTIDILTSSKAKAAGVKLTALYAPEHGVRGDIAAGASVENTRDRSGAMVYSLYGNGYKPKPEMLKDIDVLIFDIQDIGSRSYTFISTLGLAMEAAAENGKEFMVLDRPNPLGGEKVEGVIVEDGFSSFVSKYPIPYIHGMTVGELANLYNNEKMLKGGVKCKLSVVAMQGWKREMLWDETGFDWVLTSPHIPQWRTSIFYPMTGIAGELQTVNIGVGYTLPFELFATEWITDADRLASNLNAKNIPGMIFRPIHYSPYYGSAKGKTIHGVQPYVTDVNMAELTLVMYYVMEEVYNMYGRSFFDGAAADRLSMFDKVSGTDKMRKGFVDGGYKVSSIRSLWKRDVAAFKAQRAGYLIY